LKKGNRIIECESVEHDLLNVKSGLPELLKLLTKARVRLKSLKDIARLVLQLPELALLPEAFDLPGRGDEPGVYYIGAGVDMKRREAFFSWDGIDPNRVLIYCARGSQAELQIESSQRFFQLVLAVAMARPDWQFIIATGKELDAEIPS